MKRLLIEYWDCPVKERKEELDFCLKSNIESGLFDEIIICSESQLSSSFSGKNVRIINSKRKNINELIEILNYVSDDNHINILANTDILFDETINKTRFLTKNEVYSLSRWEDGVPVNCFKHVDSKKTDKSIDSELIDFYVKNEKNKLYVGSSDVWCWLGRIDTTVPIISYEGICKFADYNLGILGCDNALCYDFRFTGKIIYNPFYEIKTHHIHKTNSRPGFSSDESKNIMNVRKGAWIPVCRTNLPIPVSDFKRNNMDL